ncbi:cytochrome P450 716B1 [Ziziphus jujuba]|uniref:Cytochrome P450 716B1 n=1 Tax=Ziziphus jujuba TaxID=326968 RepID=A0A6P6G0N3_ZIZJJ|nr:cytochrome P450 716B1 [Ziziphus jujuba]
MKVIFECHQLPYTLTLILVPFLTLFLVFYLKYYFFSLRGKKLPPGKLGLIPTIGESLSFLRAHRRDKTIEWIQSHAAKYGPIFKTSLLGSKTIVMTGQAGNRFILGRNSDNGLVGNQPASAVAILGKHSIFELSGSRHKLVRGAITSILRPESIRRFVSEMDSIVKRLLFQELNGKDWIPVVIKMKRITFKVTCSLLLGLAEKDQETDKVLEDLTASLHGMWAVPLDLPGSTYRKALRARGRLSKVFSNLLVERKKELELGKVGLQDDMVSSFLSLRDENGEPLLEEEIVDNIVTLLFASHDTTSTLVSLIIRHLARDKYTFDKVYAEQKKIKGAKEGNKGQLRWGDVEMMNYTWRVAQELMRLTPPVFGNFRCAMRDTKFGGFDIPKGWQVFWVAPATHMDKEIFKDPTKFDPSRFDKSLCKSVPPYSFIPFGAGSRICPGAEFARIEVLLIIHHLILNYRWNEVIPDEPLTRNPMLYPAKGLPIWVYQREENH